jgi:hypothetical protein
VYLLVGSKCILAYYLDEFQTLKIKEIEVNT